MENTNTKKPFFYGWIIVVACMLIQAVPYGIATNVQPQFINFVTSAEGFTLTQFSLLFTIGTIVSAIASPYIGKILSDPKTNKISLSYRFSIMRWWICSILTSWRKSMGLLWNFCFSSSWYFYSICYRCSITFKCMVQRKQRFSYGTSILW